MSRSGSKVGEKVGFDPFSHKFAPKNPLFNPFQAIDKPYLKPTLSGAELFSKKGSEAA